MSAPLPNRMHNPLKDLCKRANLNYETVIGCGLSSKMREAYLNAEIPKMCDEFKSEDRKLIKHKKEFFDRKYGGSNATLSAGGAEEDKGRIRYDTGIIVESLCPDDGEIHESTAVSGGSSNVKASLGGGASRAAVWIPGGGIKPTGRPNNNSTVN